MTGIHDLGLFIVAGLLLNVTPGPDMAYIAARGAAGGLRAGVAATLGITAGCVVHTLAAAAGLSVLLATSAAAFSIVKWCGAAYLLYAGIRLVASSVRRRARGGAERAASLPPPRPRIFREAFVINVLNPKVALFFLAFLPQFIDADAPSKALAFIALGCVFNFNSLFVNLPVAWLSARAGGASARMRRRRAGSPAPSARCSCCSPRVSPRSSAARLDDCAHPSMPVIETKLDPRDATFAKNRDAMAALVEDLRAVVARVEQGGGEAASAKHVARGKLLPRERVRALHRSRVAVPRALAARRARHVRRHDRRGRHHHRHRPRQRPRMRDRLQRRHRQGRHLLPADRQEAPAGAGDRPREPPAVHLPRRFRRREPAEPDRRLSRPRPLRPDLLQPGDDVGRRAFRRSPS